MTEGQVLTAEFSMTDSLMTDFIAMLGAMIATGNEAGMPHDSWMVIKLDKLSVEELYEALKARHAN